MRSENTVVILAGGQGSRLKPYTTVLPKPLIPVCDVPILEVMIHQLRNEGFEHLILAVNHHEGLLRSYFDDGSEFGVQITYSKEDRALGTIGPLHLVGDRLTEHFLVMNGDLLTDLSFRALLDAHIGRGAALDESGGGDAGRGSVTVGTCRRTVQIGDGVVQTDGEGQITHFSEKPAISFWISNGIYAMSRSVLEFIPRNRPFGMDELVPAMLARGLPVQTYCHEGEWYDIGCAEDLERATVAFAERREKFLAPSAVRNGKPSAGSCQPSGTAYG